MLLKGEGERVAATGEPAVAEREAAGPGNIVLIELQSERVTEIATGFGEIGVAAEAVAGQAVKEMRRYLTAGVPVGIYLADQLLTVSLSRHALTNIDVIRDFVDVRIAVVEESRDVVRVEVARARARRT